MYYCHGCDAIRMSVCGECSYMVVLAFNVQVTHLMGVLGFGTFCYLLGASKLLPNPSVGLHATPESCGRFI